MHKVCCLTFLLQIKKVPKKRGRPPKPDSEKKKKTTSTTGKSKKAQAATKQQIKHYCICQTPFQSPLFMLPCDHCNKWFHGYCVNITPQMATYLDLYICDECTKGIAITWILQVIIINLFNH